MHAWYAELGIAVNTDYVMVQKVGQDFTLAEVDVWGVRQPVPKF